MRSQIKIRKLRSLILLTALLCAQPIGSNAQNAPIKPDKDFIRLQHTLESYGFRVVFQRPPRRNTYGLMNVKTKTIWINPVVFALGNAQATLVHESVHAAQSCTGTVPLHPLGLRISTDTRIRPFYLRYRGRRRQLEAEAYTVQSHPQRVNQAIALLHQHCS